MGGLVCGAATGCDSTGRGEPGGAGGGGTRVGGVAPVGGTRVGGVAPDEPGGAAGRGASAGGGDGTRRGGGGGGGGTGRSIRLTVGPSAERNSAKRSKTGSLREFVGWGVVEGPWVGTGSCWDR